MSVAMLPCRKHDVRLRDEHVAIFPPLSWRKSEQNTVRINSFPDVIVAACVGASAVRKTSVVACPQSIILRLHCLGAIGLSPHFREIYPNGAFSVNLYVSIQCNTEMAVRSMEERLRRVQRG
jgi:hypothetical protein